MQVKAISLWTYMYEGIPNEKQLEVMRMLKKEKLYNGNIPTMEEVLMEQRIYSARLPK
ncbi:hypothetical protein D3C79_1002560 [compost metagenome]